jgi:hypothetical protein
VRIFVLKEARAYFDALRAKYGPDAGVSERTLCSSFLDDRQRHKQTDRQAGRYTFFFKFIVLSFFTARGEETPTESQSPKVLFCTPIMSSTDAQYQAIDSD